MIDVKICEIPVISFDLCPLNTSKTIILQLLNFVTFNIVGIMENLSNIFASLPPTLQLFWGCAILSSIVFLVQAALTLLGLDGDSDFDLDASASTDTMDLGGGLSLFSVRSFVNFFVGFGWAGVSFYNIIPYSGLLYIVAALVGCGFVWLYFFIRRQAMRLQSDGSIDISKCVGSLCDVYLRIPANQAGTGKVQISINGSVHEFPAVTRGAQLPSGEHVKVVEVLANGVFIVEKA